jgi:hypothetical protein
VRRAVFKQWRADRDVALGELDHHHDLDDEGDHDEEEAEVHELQHLLQSLGVPVEEVGRQLAQHPRLGDAEGDEAQESEECGDIVTWRR